MRKVPEVQYDLTEVQKLQRQLTLEGGATAPQSSARHFIDGFWALDWLPKSLVEGAGHEPGHWYTSRLVNACAAVAVTGIFASIIPGCVGVTALASGNPHALNAALNVYAIEGIAAATFILPMAIFNRG